jgi:hypothetical protein
VEWENKSLIGNRIFLHHIIISSVRRVEFVSNWMSHIILRGRWCNIIVLNVHAPSEEKSDESEDSFYKNHMKILLGHFNLKVG